MIKLGNSDMFRIGVLGGIGPEATGEFYSRLIKGLQEKGLIKRNRDFPQVFINSIPAPELVHEHISDGQLKPYLKGLKEIDGFGVDFIVIVCNILHIYHERLQKEIRAPILDLRKELKRLLIKEKIRSPLIMGTLATVKQGLFKFEGVRSFEPDEKEMNQLEKAILNFNTGVDKQKQTETVRKICKKYLDKGAETAILGCTELAVMLREDRFPKIDTIDVLVGATINRFSCMQRPEKRLKKDRPYERFCRC